MPSSAFLAVIPEQVLASLQEAGAYVLQPQTRPWIDARGVVHVRLVWRGPDRATVTSCFKLRGTLPDTLLDALDAALLPVVTIDA